MTLAAGTLTPASFKGRIKIDDFVGIFTDDRSSVATPYAWTNSDLGTAAQPIIDTYVGHVWDLLMWGPLKLVAVEPTTPASGAMTDMLVLGVLYIAQAERYPAGLETGNGLKHPRRVAYEEIFGDGTTAKPGRIRDIADGRVPLPAGFTAITDTSDTSVGEVGGESEVFTPPAFSWSRP